MLNNLTNNTGSTCGSNTTKQINDLCNCVDDIQTQVNCNTEDITNNTNSINNLSTNVCTVNVSAQCIVSKNETSDDILANKTITSPKVSSECFTTGSSSMTDTETITPVVRTSYICSPSGAINVCADINTLDINATGNLDVAGDSTFEGNTRIKGTLTLDSGVIDLDCVKTNNTCAKYLTAESASIADITGTAAEFTDTVKADEITGTACVSTACVKSTNIQNSGNILTSTSCNTGTMMSTHIISSDVIDAAPSGGAAYTIITIPKFSGEVSFYTDAFRFTVRDNVDITYEDSSNQAHLLYFQYVPATGSTNIAIKDAANIGYGYDIANTNDIAIVKSYSTDVYPSDIYTYTNLNQFVKKGHVMIYENVSGADEGMTVLGNFYATNWTMPQSMSYEVFIAQKLGIGNCLYSLDNSCVCIDLCSRGIKIDNCGDTDISSNNYNGTALTAYKITAPAVCIDGTTTATGDITAPNFHGTADKVAHKLTVNQTISGVSTSKEYDGSSAVSVDIAESSLCTDYTNDIASSTSATNYNGANDVKNTLYKPDQNVNKASNVQFCCVCSTGQASLTGIVDNGNLTVCGDIYQCGSAYCTHAEDIYTKCDYIHLREGATTGLSGTCSGLEFICYDGTNNGRIEIDCSGTVRVGDTGTTQPVATRKESGAMTDGKLVCWNTANNRIETSPNTGLSTCDLVSTVASGCACPVSSDGVYSYTNCDFKAVSGYDATSCSVCGTFKFTENNGNVCEITVPKVRAAVCADCASSASMATVLKNVIGFACTMPSTVSTPVGTTLNYIGDTAIFNSGAVGNPDAGNAWLINLIGESSINKYFEAYNTNMTKCFGKFDGTNYTWYAELNSLNFSSYLGSAASCNATSSIASGCPALITSGSVYTAIQGITPTISECSCSVLDCNCVGQKLYIKRAGSAYTDNCIAVWHTDANGCHSIGDGTAANLSVGYATSSACAVCDGSGNCIASTYVPRNASGIEGTVLYSTGYSDGWYIRNCFGTDDNSLAINFMDDGSNCLKIMCNDSVKSWICACNGTYYGTADCANYLMVNGVATSWLWSGNNSTPSWLWGGGDGGTMCVYNPAYFSVCHAVCASSAATACQLCSTNVSIGAGCADCASMSTNNNMLICSWWGIGFQTYTGAVCSFMNTRNGDYTTCGTITAAAMAAPSFVLNGYTVTIS